MSEAPVIFLDIDGVLVTHESLKSGGSSCADRYCVGLLNKLVEDLGAEIVVSSSWRILHSLDFIRGALAARGLSKWRAIIDKTESIHYRTEGGMVVGCATRADEIRAWLAAHPERTNYVIFDDDWDAEIEGHYVRTDMERGLTNEHLLAALNILTSDES